MSTPTAPDRRRTARRSRRLAVGSTAALLVAVLAACGDDPAATAGSLSPVEVPSGSASAAPSPPAPSTPAPTATATATTTTATLVDAGAELEVEDQSGDGSGVRVEEARLSSGNGHVAVQTRDGQVLGSAPVTRGSQPVTIPLRPRLTGSGELLAVLHADDGDGVFDPARDAVVVDDDGEREAEDFDYRVR